MTKMYLHEISAVDKPAQEGATVSVFKRDFSAEERHAATDSGAAMPDGSFPIKSREDLHNAMQAIGRAKDPSAVKAHIRSRAKSLGLESELSDAFKKNDNPESASSADQPTMTPEQIEQLKKDAEQAAKRAERAEKLSKLNDAEKQVLQGLPVEKQDEFLNQTPEQRSAEVAKRADANAVIYTSASGEQFRKSDDPRLVAMAKKLDGETKLRIEAEAVSKREKLVKRAATELKFLKGDEGAKADLLSAIDTLPEATQKTLSEMLKGHNEKMAKAFEEVGSAGEGENDAEESLNKLAREIQKSDKKMTFEAAYAKALDTPEGREFYEQVVEQRS
ncbi:MAG: hypothetical protein ACRDP6_26675 [Actinoallomurus sp.]